MGLSDKQIEFMKYMESTVLPNRRNVSYDVLGKAGSYVGIAINTSCRSCAQKSGTDLLNMYGSLKPTWLAWQDEQKKKDEMITTQYENELKKKELEEFNKIQEVKEAKTDLKLEEWTPINKRKKNTTK